MVWFLFRPGKNLPEIAVNCFVDANDLNFNKKTAQNAISINPGIQIASNPTNLNFTNSNMGSFVPL